VNYWLIKSEPEAFSWNDLEKAKAKTTCWDGVRNYQARNTLRDSMKKGDLALFYHSSADPCAVMGTVEIVREGYVDPTQFDAKHDHFDPKAKADNPPWFMVDVRAKTAFKTPVTLEALKAAKGLEGIELLRRGSRLSVQPVSEAHFKTICKMGGASAL
jgi:predicted RNA-binding protein with PUA-like domain